MCTCVFLEHCPAWPSPFSSRPPPPPANNLPGAPEASVTPPPSLYCLHLLCSSCPPFLLLFLLLSALLLRGDGALLVVHCRQEGHQSPGRMRLSLHCTVSSSSSLSAPFLTLHRGDSHPALQTHPAPLPASFPASLPAWPGE